MIVHKQIEVVAKYQTVNPVFFLGICNKKYTPEISLHFNLAFLFILDWFSSCSKPNINIA